MTAWLRGGGLLIGSRRLAAEVDTVDLHRRAVQVVGDCLQLPPYLGRLALQPPPTPSESSSSGTVPISHRCEPAGAAGISWSGPRSGRAARPERSGQRPGRAPRRPARPCGRLRPPRPGTTGRSGPLRPAVAAGARGASPARRDSSRRWCGRPATVPGPEQIGCSPASERARTTFPFPDDCLAPAAQP